ncbi:hypothetical protein HNV11_09305 [Spirosoma taeanense]|uniref:DUF2846 domain-containing protein n=1 Tax=Spirosoma taeanense TaxID=2735870 RepID=A0A6M5Y8Q2_9BACT|nr:hypothetical protein [Spirosoma taeanense]QJW89563.1 hypothetical protein HNV11_09305 [Spirosoma taeanense]
MATRNAVRSLRNLFVVSLAISALTSACKQSGSSEPEIDPREQYVGTYVGGYQSIIRFGGAELKPESGTISVGVSKGSNPKEIYIDVAANRPYKVTAELNGSNFTVIDRNKDQIFVQGTTFDGDYKATGVFDQNQIAIATTTESLQGGTLISRSESITGTKK